MPLVSIVRNVTLQGNLLTSKAVGAPMGGVFGNILSGIVAEYSTWKWVFFATAFMGGAITIAGVFLIPTVPAPSGLAKASNRVKAASVDWLGGVLVTVALLLLTFALTEGNIVGWRTPWIAGLIVASAVLLAVFVTWQWYLETKTSRKPLMKISMFWNRRFSAVMAIMAVFFSSYNNFVIFATYFFQDYQGLSPLQTMLRFLPTGASGIVTVGVMAKLLSRVRTYYLIIYGASVMCIAALLFAVPIPPETTYFAWGFIAMILSVNGSDTLWPCLTLFTSSALPAEDQALGGALLVACGQVGRSIGLAISTAVQTAVMAHARGVTVENVGPVSHDAASLKGIRVAGWINFAFGVCALLISLFMLRSKEVIGKTR